MQQDSIQASTLSWQREGERLVLNGELDRDTLGLFWQQRDTLLIGVSELNVASLARVDSYGLAVLVYLLGESQSGGRPPLRLTGITSRLQTLITLYNLSALIETE